MKSKGQGSGWGRWRVYGPNGDQISGSHFWYMGDAKQWLEGHVGRTVIMRTHDSGVHSVDVNTKTYWILQETGPGFPPGSGLEHKSLVAKCPHCFMEAHPGTECW
jgi:hypothetical protein